ncbi:amidohydrolase family protein [Cupriavidus basilensis]
MLQEAGFNPLEVLRAATSHGAALLGMEETTGSVEVGKRADLLVHDSNPLDDLKLLYGTGALRLDEVQQRGTWERCLRVTPLRTASIFDRAELLADVEMMVAAEKASEKA